MIVISILSIFGLVLGMLNGGAFHDYKKKINNVTVLFYLFSFLSFGFLFMWWGVVSEFDNSLNSFERLLCLFIPPSLWIFSFIDTYKGRGKIQKIVDGFKNTFRGIFKIFGSFLGIVLIIIFVVIVIFLLVKLVKYFWYL